jgi:hypothetical protein
MRLDTRSAIAGLVLAIAMGSAVPAAFAQTPPPQDHSTHHPPGAAPGQPAAPTPPTQGGMMGQGGMMAGMMCADMMGKQADGKPGEMGQMMPMMQHMMTMMSARSGMMMPNVEGRIATLKTELKISDAQMPQWNRFADALRATASSMNEMHKTMMQSDRKSLPDRMAAREQMMTTHLAAMKSLREALQPLYATLGDEQKKVADQIMIGPMGMM